MREQAGDGGIARGPLEAEQEVFGDTRPRRRHVRADASARRPVGLIEHGRIVVRADAQREGHW